ncbi:MAG: M20/M25/M40 family metallo-hydrolase [Thalassotalea sp.]|nr:M20/M25/M40 family metallo-hydrolase [Thalassotalea sp.]
MNKIFIVLIIASNLLCSSANAEAQIEKVSKIHQQIANSNVGIGAREAGSIKEKDTAKYISTAFKEMGLSTSEQEFSFGKDNLKSRNIIADTNPLLAKTIVLAAHYDSTAKNTGSLGATDNGAGLAAMLVIASTMSKKKVLEYNIRFIAFGAEEVGLQGSKYYVQQLSKNIEKRNEIIAMVNFDTIAGGDYIYVHSAHTTPYKCSLDNAQYNSDTNIREALLAASKKVLGEKNQYVIHPEYEGYPKGVTGSWSDHAPFACAGIPIAYVESTNFTINGKDGYDGYSQSIHPALWDCYDDKNKTACNRNTETKWGNIWHSQFDKIETLEQLFPNRVTKQLLDNINVMNTLLSDFYQFSK